jgi:proteasome lid subunit RPN8/RPN11
MRFFIRRIIRAFGGSEPELVWNRTHYREVMAELDRRGGRNTEAGAFLLGHRSGNIRYVNDVVYYDDLDPAAYSTGICVLKGPSFSKLWTACRERAVEVVADVHTHGGAPSQSGSDRTNPMVAQQGHLAIIVPDFARPPVRIKRLGIYRYAGSHRWDDLGGRRAERVLQLEGWPR